VWGGGGWEGTYRQSSQKLAEQQPYGRQVLSLNAVPACRERPGSAVRLGIGKQGQRWARTCAADEHRRSDALTS
jgi:hypothetical protein